MRRTRRACGVGGEERVPLLRLQSSGTVLDWVMKTQGVSLPHAVQLLRNDAPLAGVEKVGMNRSQARRLPFLAAGSDEAVLLREVAGTYHAT